MFNSPIFSVAIGVVFLFAVLATLATAITEAVAWFFGLRSAFLMRGLLSLVDGSSDATGDHLRKLLSTAVLQNQGTQGTLPTGDLQVANKRMWVVRGLRAKRSWPSYIPARSFAGGVLHLIMQNAGPKPQPSGRNLVQRLLDIQPPHGGQDPTMQQIESGISKLKKTMPGAFVDQLNNLASTAFGDVDQFRRSVETWYDDHMERVSGWYKRYTRWITALTGLVVVVGLNVQIFAFADSLYTSQALSRDVVSKAVAAKPCNEDAAACINDARKQLKSLEPTLNLGWNVVPDCQSKVLADESTPEQSKSCSFFEKYGITAPPGGGSDNWALVTVLVGYLLTVLALIPGSRFWYDLLNRFGSFRSSGPRPAPSSATS